MPAPTLTAADLDQAAERIAPTLTEPERKAWAVPPALTFDERLALAALAVDARIATEPLDLADVIRGPVDAPAPQLQPYRTPIAALLHRAHTRLEREGWCAGALRDEQGRRCALGAVRIESGGDRGAEADAMSVLLDALRRRFPGADSVPSWNDAQRDGAPVVRLLGDAAEMAHARGF